MPLVRDLPIGRVKAIQVRWRARLFTVQLNVVVYLNGKAAGMVSGTSVNDHGIVELI